MNITLKNVEELFDLEQLDDVGRMQLAKCGELWDGNDWPAERRLREAEEPEEGNFFGEGLTVHEVWVDGEHRYDAWTYMVDSGAVFTKGTTDVVLSRVQFDWSASGGDAALATAIGELIT